MLLTVFSVAAVRAQETPDTLPLERALTVPNAAMVNAHLRFLADDALRGRAPGTAGADIAARYIRSQFEEAGLEPGAPDGSFFQPVRLVGVTPSPSLVIGVAQRTTTLRYLEEFVAWPVAPDSTLIADGEIVFVGHGIVAPEWRWDDYKGFPMTGRILLVLSNDPGLADSTVFNGRQLTYYGGWRYKLEQAARLGAAGAILIHSPERTGDSWPVVRSTWSGEQIQLEGRATQTLRFGAWIGEATARRIIRAAGIDYDLMTRRATRRDFRPIAMAAHAAVDIASRVRSFESVNVIGRLRAQSEEAEQAVVFTAHYDQRGVGHPAAGDSVYNGAWDNASGVAALLATATGLASAGAPPARSLIFVATTASESGQLGAEAYLRTPPVPLARTAAIIDIERANIWGGTRDVVALGAYESTLVETAEAAAEAEAMTLVPDPRPELGSSFRSDHFPFAREGVPAVSLRSGIDFIDQPPEWGRRQWEDSWSTRYRRPGDGYRPDFRYEGLLQQVRLLMRFGWWLSATADYPSWNEGSQYRAAGDRLRGNR